ncbi:MAG: PQQ-dependent sugar dehydrogenase [Thermosynechococcaceae cyanobacterium]
MKQSVWVTQILLLVGCMIMACKPIEARVEDTLQTNVPASDSASSTEAQSANPKFVAQGATYQLMSLVAGLEHPWGMVWLPNGDILVTERAGRLRRIRNGALQPTSISGLPPIFAMGQGGLLDIALHPKFADNQLVYFTYADGDRNANRTRVARAQFDGEALQNWQVIFEAAPDKPSAQHFGSRLVWLPDETLLVSFGDGGNPPVSVEGDLIRLQAQNLESYLGKVVRIQADGSIPTDNPKIAGTNGPSAIWSYGHRNIQGLAYDAISKQIWATEHGSRGGDEINQLRSGANYGWPLVSHSREYSTGEPVAPVQSKPGMVDPKIVWTPAIAPSGLAIYRGDRFPQWQGNLFAGGLVSQDIRRIEVDGQGTVREVEKIDIGQRVRDVRQGPDGLLYVLTDAPKGQLLRLEPRL